MTPALFMRTSRRDSFLRKHQNPVPKSIISATSRGTIEVRVWYERKEFVYSRFDRREITQIHLQHY